jgi:hypothetical protein
MVFALSTDTFVELGRLSPELADVSPYILMPIFSPSLFPALTARASSSLVQLATTASPPSVCTIKISPSLCSRPPVSLEGKNQRV